MKKILITGNAGFIGFHLFRRLEALGFEVYGIDNLNHYYDVNLKLARLRECGFAVESIAYGRTIDNDGGGKFCQLDLTDADGIAELFRRERFDGVCHLAAQAGVRYSVRNPSVYIESNLRGFFNILTGCKQNPVEHFVFASSSSIYGNSQNTPFREDDPAATPVNLYAATKKSDELMAYSYASLFQIPTTGLRFFTVYGPWCRPDMALLKFAIAIRDDRSIPLYNHGDMARDFTYIDDIVEGIVRVLPNPLCKNDPSPCRVYNIGFGHPVKLIDFVHILEEEMGKKARIEMLPFQSGDMYCTWADTTKLQGDYDYTPVVPIRQGVRNFVQWFQRLADFGIGDLSDEESDV